MKRLKKIACILCLLAVCAVSALADAGNIEMGGATPQPDQPTIEIMIVTAIATMPLIP